MNDWAHEQADDLNQSLTWGGKYMSGFKSSSFLGLLPSSHICSVVYQAW